MAARQIIVPGAMPARDQNGHALPSKLRFYAPGSGGATPKSVYTTSALAVAHSFPILSDSAGRFPQIWAEEDQVFDVTWSDQVYDAAVATYADVRPLSDAVLASAELAEAAAGLAQDAQAAAEEAATAAQAVADTLDLTDFDPISVPYVTQAEATAFLATQQVVMTFGYDGYDPRAAATWKRVAGEPEHPGWFRSNDRYLPNGSASSDDGGYWELSVREASVLTFGAKGDDVADDAAALQRALDYGIMTGVPIYADEGTYRFGTPLSIDFTTYVNRPFTLKGAGWGWETPGGMLTDGKGTILRYTGDPSLDAWTMKNDQYVTTSQNGRVHFADFALIGPGGAGPGGDGFACQVMNNTVFDNLFVGYFRGKGYDLVRCYVLELREGLVTGNFVGGVDFAGAANTVRVFRTKIYGNGGDWTTSGNFGLRFSTSNPANCPIVDGVDVSYNGTIGYVMGSSLTSVVVSGGVATATTAAPHGRTTGNYIAVGLATTNALNTGTAAPQITVTGTTTFTWATSALNGTYNGASDHSLRIGTYSVGMDYEYCLGMQVLGPICEVPLGLAIRIGNGCEAYEMAGGFILGGGVHVTSAAGYGRIDNIILEGQEAILVDDQADNRCKLDVGRGVRLRSNASISRGAYFRTEGQWFGNAKPTSGSWMAGDRVRSTVASATAAVDWVCITAGTPGMWSPMAAVDATATWTAVQTFDAGPVIKNGVSLKGKNTAGTAISLVAYGSDDFIYIGDSSLSQNFSMRGLNGGLVITSSGITCARNGANSAYNPMEALSYSINAFAKISDGGALGAAAITKPDGSVFDVLAFGPFNNSTPALKVVGGSGLAAYLADGSSYTTFYAATYRIGSSGYLTATANGVLVISDQNTTGAVRFCLAGTTSSFPSLVRNGSSLDVRLADNSSFTQIAALNYRFAAQGNMRTVADGLFVLENNTATGVTGLAFGGTTNSFPMLKRNSSGLISRLADDSADAAFTSSTFNASATGPSYFFGGATSSYPAIKRNATTVAVRLADDSDDAPITCLTVRTKAMIVSALPSASVAGAGAQAFVTDATATIFLSAVSGGGSNKVPVISDGTNWLIG